MTSKINNSVHLDRLLIFEDVFPNEKRLAPEEYLEGGKRSLILNLATLFLGSFGFNSKYRDNKEVLQTIFGTENNELANSLYNQIISIEKGEIKISIIHTYSSLKLFEYFFGKKDVSETQTNSEFEVNFFKAYLVFNSEFISAQKVAISSVKDIDIDLKVPMMMFCMHYPIADKTNYDINQIWTTQIIKATYLFQFLEANKKAKPILAAFLNHFGQATWQDYLKHLLTLTKPAIMADREVYTNIDVIQDDKYDENCKFIEKLIVNEKDELEENDFITLRSSPLYKVKEGVYQIIFNLFVVEKIYKGVYFQLRDVNDKLLDSSKIKDLKGYYGLEFSEKTLLYRVIETIYKNNCIHYSGMQLADLRIDGAPDYYIRKGQNIILFETKDFLIKKEVKASFDFIQYETEFQKILYYEELPDGKVKNKAVIQLINFIKKILKNEFIVDKDYRYRDVYIYPVLITHDNQYDTPGFNNLINYWFQGELEDLKKEGFFIKHIKPLMIVNIDSLIYNQVGLAETIPLHDVLKLYEGHINQKPKMKFRTEEEYKQFRMSKLFPFSYFLTILFKEKGICKQPPILDIVASELFKEEYEKRNKSTI